MIESEMLDDRTLMDRSGSVVSGSGADIVCTTKRDNLRTFSVEVQDSSLRSADTMVVVAAGMVAAGTVADAEAAGMVVGGACRACRSELTEAEASASMLDEREWSWNSLVVDTSSRSGSLPAAQEDDASARRGDSDAGPVSRAIPATLRSRVRLLLTGLDAE